MKVYLFLLGWSVLWMLLYNRGWCQERVVLGETRQVPKWQYVILALIPMFLTIGLRGGLMDSYLYRLQYINFPTEYSQISAYLETRTSSKLFAYLSALFKVIFKVEYYWWFFTLTVLSCFFLCKTLRKYSEDFGISMYVFVASTMFTWLMNGVRQFLVVCILVSVFDWIIEKKYGRLLLLIWICSYIHQSVLMMIPLVFVVQTKPWGKTMSLVVLLSLATLIITDTFTDVLFELTQESEYGEDWSNIKNDSGASILRAFVAAVPTLLAFFKRKEIEAESPPEYINLCINFSVLTVGLYLFASVTSGIYIGRLPIYCEVFNLILFPWLISVPYKSERKIYTISLLIFYAVYFVYQMFYVWNLEYFSQFWRRYL